MHRFTHELNRILEIVIALCVAAAVLVVLWGVFSRFLINVPSRWTEELAGYLLTWIAVLGSAVAFRRHQHLGVDYFYRKLDPDAARLNAILIQLIVILFAVCVMIWGGSTLVLNTLATGADSAALGLRVGYTYLAVPIAGVAMVLFAIEHIVKTIAFSSPSSSVTSSAADSKIESKD